MRHKTQLLALLVAILAVIGAGIGAATLTDDSVSLDQPDNQHVEVDLDYSGDATTTVNLSKDGTTVLSATNTSSTVGNVSIDTTGLDTGDYNLSVTADDESNVSIDETRIVTEQTDVWNMTANETYTVDVYYDAQQVTNATVEFLDDSGTVLNSTTLSFDPVEYADGSGVLTAEFTPSSDYNFTDVRVATDPASGYDSMFTVDLGGIVGGGGSGGLFGASSEQVLGFALLLGGLLVLSSREVFE